MNRMKCFIRGMVIFFMIKGDRIVRYFKIRKNDVIFIFYKKNINGWKKKFVEIWLFSYKSKE